VFETNGGARQRTRSKIAAVILVVAGTWFLPKRAVDAPELVKAAHNRW
jgi:hypothetical protein